MMCPKTLSSIVLLSVIFPLIHCTSGDVDSGLISLANFEEEEIDECYIETIDKEPYSPLVPCQFLDARFIRCENPADVETIGNSSRQACPYFGVRNNILPKINVTCSVFPCIECSGPRIFQKEAKCLKYTGHYFLSTLLYSIFLGILGIDRLCLGYSAIGVGKLMTAGGLGVWWLVDIFLLVNGNLTPADDSQWMPYW
jgi:hypothetical protein